MNTQALPHRDPVLKGAARELYRAGLLLHALATGHARSRVGRVEEPKVYYGGARSGDIGGPLVKMKRLTEAFPEHLWDYNLVYVLSNAAYLPTAAVLRFKRHGIEIVHNQDGVFYPAWYAGDWQAANSRMAVTYHAAKHVFWQSGFCRRAANRFLGERDGAGEILYNAVDTVRFTPRRESGDDRRPCRFLVTGKFTSHIYYRLETTVRGLALARKRGQSAELLCAGWFEPSVLAGVRHLADTLGVASLVDFRGPYTQADAPGIYRSADVYVTTKHMDPCPNAVIEALACGLPVLYSSSGGVPEMVGSEAGIGIDAPEDWEQTFLPTPEAVAAGMLAIAEDRQSRGLAARQRAVEKFGLAAWLQRHRAVFQEILADVR